MQVYNTMERAVVPLEPSDEGRVTMYVCGPTVQSEPHLGHGRSAVSFDVLRRYLEWIGHEVIFVRNVTDVDDKIITMAAETGMTTDEVAERAFNAFDEAYRRLGNLAPTIEPRATEHIPEMIALIEELLTSGHAYEAEGDVYFAVRSFDRYGRLSRHDVDDLRAGQRVEPGERKRDPLDFALWKASKPGEPQWDSPWGPGRPGWHIECSAMATKYLGPGFDIHAGGTDLIFPHHENEIAQSEAPTGTPFSRYWMHNGMLNLRGEKMAKSTGHVVTLLDSLDRWEPLAVRLFYLRTHYRKPLDFTPDALDDAEASLGRMRSFRRRAPAAIEAEPAAAPLEAFKAAMDDDLDVAGALAVVFDTVRTGNAAFDSGEDAEPLVAAFDEMIDVLGLAEADEAPEVDVSGVAASLGVPEAGVDELVDLREQARSERDWERADAIRDGLASVGIVIEDTPDGARWHRG
ncbi:MAG: cysteine--tRNA ligase [Acidimicrobiia bacterium]|nr:cysteine--tRNA ligase [Acidimicrobiia bacterium]